MTASRRRHTPSNTPPESAEDGWCWVGGYSQDTSHAPLRIADLSRPAVNASQVVDRETLIAFVEAAAKVYSDRALNTEGYRDFAAVRNAFRQEGGALEVGFRLFVDRVRRGTLSFFMQPEPFREGKAPDLTRTDINGVMFAEELIGGARREGRKFLQYYYEDPSIEGGRGHRLPEARLCGEHPGVRHRPKGRHWLRRLSWRTAPASSTRMRS